MQITIHLEKGRSFWEKAVMKVMAAKQKRLGLSVNPFSHVAIFDGQHRHHTHPKHGVIMEQWEQQPPNPNRTEIEIEVDDLTVSMFWHSHQLHKGKPYNYISVLQGFTKFLTGIWIGFEPKNISKVQFNCASWAAYLLNKPEWWKCDLVDLQIWIEKNATLQKKY